MKAMNPDRLLFLTLGLSLLGHAAVLGAELMLPGWGQWTQAIKPLKLVYEPEKTSESSQLTKVLGQARESSKELSGPSAMTPSTHTLAESYQPQSSGDASASLISQITIGAVSRGGGASMGSSGGTNWDTAADLTNLATAAQGNPVLYTYFSAVREQIQDTANAQAWVAQDASHSGTVYVGFVISRSGTIESAGIVEDRSIESSLLRNAGLQIVKASGRFLPLPPSFTEDAITLVVPIQFASDY